MKKDEPIKIWCKRCLQWLVHDKQRCPLFPKVAAIKKWSECVCTVHTCYDAKATGIKRNKRSAPTYVDF
jgi:RNA polymerase subunit RPABC4/transcription elongation factor Spt4